MADLKGKNVLLTGGLGSLGRAQATKLSREGARIVVLDRPDSTNAEARVAELGRNVSFLGCDLNDLNSAQKIVAGAAENLGGFDILINNAALIINRPYRGILAGGIRGPDPGELFSRVRAHGRLRQGDEGERLGQDHQFHFGHAKGDT